MTNFRKLKSNGTNSVFINPANASDRLSFNVYRQPKKLNGLVLENAIVDVKANRNFDPRVTKTDAPFNEPLKVGISLSGSVQSQATLRAMLDDAYYAIVAKWDELFKVGVAPDEAANIIYHEVVTPEA